MSGSQTFCGQNCLLLLYAVLASPAALSAPGRRPAAQFAGPAFWPALLKHDSAAVKLFSLFCRQKLR